MAFKEVATQVATKSALVFKKHGPEILTGVGIFGGITAAVLGAKATLKLEPIIDKMNADIQVVNEMVDDYETQSEYTRDKASIYVRGALKITRLYGPAISIGATSVGCVIAAHGIMRRRNVALVAAYSVLEKSFDTYRQRVIEEFGEEKDRQYRQGEYQEKVKNSETGKNELVTRRDPSAISGYARFFDDGSIQWSKTPEYNLNFLRMQQEYANQRLQMEGYLFLNDVYEALGIPKSQAGQVVGWYIGKEGDNFVDFGMYDIESDRARDFINGKERSILLDFNVDGVIVDKLP